MTGLLIKFLSHRKYLSEVSVENKITYLFFRKILRFDIYASQIIRTGSCITLLSNQVSLNSESFLDKALFEDYVKFVYWTFNDGFLLIVKEQISLLKLAYANYFHCILSKYPEPYTDDLNGIDEELTFCLLKRKAMKEHSSFDRMFALDSQNRQAILKSLAERIDELKSKESNGVSEPEALPSVSFLQMLNPISGSQEETLSQIKSCLIKARYKHDLFIPAVKSTIGRNPKGFNGAVAAMISFFHANGYFLPEFTTDDIFQAYFAFTGNSIAKYDGSIRLFDNDADYHKNLLSLRQLGINKL